MIASLKKEKSVLFGIAGHGVEVVLPDTFDWVRLLPAFQPFRCDSSMGNETICSIRITETPIDIEQDATTVRYDVYGLLGHWFCLMETDQNYIVEIQYVENGSHYRMITDKTFSTGTAYIDGKDANADVILSLFLMIIFGQSAVLHQTILIHASVVEKDGQGYVFLGKSGMGKSTHSQLWLRHIEGTELLNDDNPAIRLEKDGSVNIYGTPWSGKTPCYKNRKVRLKALVRLEQASANRFIWKEGVDALITLLPSCLSMRWNTFLYTEMCNLLETVIGKVKVGYLECLPDKEAALLCNYEINIL